MPSSVFNKIVPDDLLGDFLKTNCYIDPGSSTIIDRTTYKKSILEGSLFPFLSSLLTYYHQSTRFYLTRKMTYTRFLTVLRQLFRHHEIAYNVKVTHTSAKKEVVYTIANATIV